MSSAARQTVAPPRVAERDLSDPGVTVAVLNYNGRELLEVVLPSLARQTYRDFETVVIDDCSSDDSLEYLARCWPQVRVVSAGERNVGVAAALNLAVRSARRRLLALLNNDIELDPGWLGELVAGLERHPSAGSASCKLLNYWRRNELDGAGDVFTRDGTAFRRGHGEPDVGQYEREEYVFAPTAGAALYRMEVLDAVGPFDESFFAYLEDVDWGLRAQLAGYRCLYVPTAIGYHMGSATTGGERDRFYFRLQRRNLIALLIKNPPLRFLLRHLPRLLWAQLQLAIHSARAGMLSVYLRAVLEAASLAPGWLRARVEIRRGRRIGARDFERLVREWAP